MGHQLARVSRQVLKLHRPLVLLSVAHVEKLVDGNGNGATGSHLDGGNIYATDIEVPEIALHDDVLEEDIRVTLAQASTPREASTQQRQEKLEETLDDLDRGPGRGGGIEGHGVAGGLEHGDDGGAEGGGVDLEAEISGDVGAEASVDARISGLGLSEKTRKMESICL